MTKNTKAASLLLENVARLQHEFWDELKRLEDALGVEIDSTNDLGNTDIKTLIKRGEAEA
jgi:hypothetical protein